MAAPGARAAAAEGGASRLSHAGQFRPPGGAARRAARPWLCGGSEPWDRIPVVGHIMLSDAAPVATPWIWTLAYGQHQDRSPTHGHESTREAAMQAFARSWHRETFTVLGKMLELLKGMAPNITRAAALFNPATGFYVPGYLRLFEATPRKKRTRPKPRQYTIADLERARDRVAAAERRIDNNRTNNPNRGRAGLERAQLELSVIESQLRLRGLLE